MHSGEHHVQIDARAGDEHQSHVDQDEKQEPLHREKVDRSGSLPIQCFAEPAQMI